MKIVCYAFKNQDNKMEASFLEYPEKYSFGKNDSEKDKLNKNKKLGNIKMYLEYLKNKKGFYNIPPIVQKYHNHSISILKIKESTKLVRIAFFTKSGDKIILLNAIDKPKLYEKGIKKKINKKIAKFLIQAERYMKDYLKNNLFLQLTLIK